MLPMQGPDEVWVMEKKGLAFKSAIKLLHMHVRNT